MNNLTLPLYTAAETRELDRLAIEQKGIAGYTLMKRAATATFQQLLLNWPNCRRLTTFCGAGNNGGDGYIIAQLAHEQGIQVQVFYLGDLEKQRDDALAARLDMLASGVELKPFTLDVVLAADTCNDVIVDAILGTGLERDVNGLCLSAIQKINSSSAKIIAVDIPSGLHADTGCQMGGSVCADLTVTFIARKQGLYTADGKANTGEVIFDDLNIPASLYTQVPCSSFMLPTRLSGQLLKPRKTNSHKGSHGHVLLVGGGLGMSGAIIMAACAALRSGCGLVSVATHFSHASTVTEYQPEIMSHGIQSSGDLLKLMDAADVIVLGPGLGESEWSEMIFETVIASAIEKPLVIDADGLNYLSVSPRKNKHWILTPHPGEAASLLNCSNKLIQANRFDAIKKLQNKYGGVCVLKGSGTLISDGKIINICTSGNPGMASAGMGDVLSGVIASTVAQAVHINKEHQTKQSESNQSAMTILDIASFGVCLHAAAGDLAAKENGEKGLLASDLFPYIRRLINAA